MKKRSLPMFCALVLVLAAFEGQALLAEDSGAEGQRPAAASGPPLLPPGEGGDCAQEAASLWAVERVDTTKSFQDMRDNSLALDVNGYPHIAYGADHLYYAYFDGTAWNLSTVDAADGVGTYASLELDGAGRPHIGYYDRPNDALKYARYDGTAWQIEVVDPNDAMC